LRWLQKQDDDEDKSYHIISYHIVDFKWQNRLKVGTDKPKLKVKMQSVSDDDVWKRLLEWQPIESFKLQDHGQQSNNRQLLRK